MRKNRKYNYKNPFKQFTKEKGSVAVIVTVTILFFMVILSTTYMINAIMRQSQLKSQISLKESYEETLDLTQNAPAPTINDVTIGNVTYNSMQVTVTASSSSAYPIIQYEYSSDGGSTYISSTSSSYTFSGLSFGTTYNIVVRVLNSGNKTVTSSSKSQTTTIPSASTFAYTGNYQTYTVPSTGKYKLEVWGAQGGSVTSARGGYGAYAVGEVELQEGNNIYIYVGGEGKNATTTDQEGGYNGGGLSVYSTVSSERGSGGGATHIATTSGIISTMQDKVSSILILAGGGGRRCILFIF